MLNGILSSTASGREGQTLGMEGDAGKGHSSRGLHWDLGGEYRGAWWPWGQSSR